MPKVGEPQLSPLLFQSSDRSHQTDSHQFAESTISLYHYAGYALHSMMQTAKTRVAAGKAEHDRIAELTILKELLCNSEDLKEVPDPIKDLCVNNLCIVSPSLIPFVRSLIDKVLLGINGEQLKSKGQHMVADAKKSLLITQEFRLCVNTILDNKGSKFESNIEDLLEKIGKEFSNKIINARINEFFKAKKELDLEADKRVVDCDQSLRDQLKTFSSLKSRH